MTHNLPTSDHSSSPESIGGHSGSSNSESATTQDISKKDRVAAYSNTLKQARTHMHPLGGNFSRFIHLRGIELLSDSIGSTLMRPRAILYGSIASLLSTFVLYFSAKYFGYPLSGSESIAAFIAGWLIGIITDYTRMLIRGGR